MKYSILITLLMAISTMGFSQDYMDDITKQTCECVDNASEPIGTEKFNMELGLCMIQAAEPYQKKLKKDYNIDFAHIDTHGEELGRIIGMKMLTVCPESLMKVAGGAEGEQEEAVTEIAEEAFEGQVIGIDDDKFIEFSVKGELGKITKFYWFTYVESDIELTNNYNSVLDKPVRISYIAQEFFDARINEYRDFNVILKIEIVED